MSAADTRTPLDLFKLFLTEEAVRTLCDHTNKQAALTVAKGIKYKWTDVGVAELYKYIGLIFYMSVIKMVHVTDYWRQNKIFSIPFPATVMGRDRWRSISWNVRMSDPQKDPGNSRRKGAHDDLFQARPLLDTLRTACKAFYHPHKNLIMHHRTAATHNFRLFMLADAGNGYTVDFAVYVGKHSQHLGRKVSYGAVMSLVNRSFLGWGYHVYTDSFYTSPKLFRALHEQSFGACGMHSPAVKGCPHSTSNALTKSSGRGAIRWIRDGPLLFVKWLDAEEVSVCSTVHTAYTGDTVQRRVKPTKGASVTETYPCPSPLVALNKHMQGVDVSDQFTQYFATQHKVMDWSRKLFFHFLDMAARNACILYNEVASQQQRAPLMHKAFMKQLTAQLCGVTDTASPYSQVSSDHVPVPVAKPSATGGRPGSQVCHPCGLCRKKQTTPWKCKGCGVALCLQFDRNCFEEWHKSA